MSFCIYWMHVYIVVLATHFLGARYGFIAALAFYLNVGEMLYNSELISPFVYISLFNLILYIIYVKYEYYYYCRRYYQIVWLDNNLFWLINNVNKLSSLSFMTYDKHVTVIWWSCWCELSSKVQLLMAVRPTSKLNIL